MKDPAYRSRQDRQATGQLFLETRSPQVALRSQCFALAHPT